MNLCSSGHDEVCYDGHMCPMCVALDTIEQRDKEIENLKDEMDDLKSQLSEREST